jgi:glycosyltransferase involved in cell wall biosynthesis
VKLIAHNEGTEMRGNERQLLLLANALRSRGHDILISSRPGSPLEAELARRQFRTTRVRPRGDLDAWNALRFAWLLRRERPDAVMLTSWKRVLPGAWAARRARVRRVVVRLGLARELPQRPASRWKLKRAFTHYVDALIVNSREVAERWLQSAPWFPERRLHLILNAVEPVRAAGHALHTELKLSEDTRIIVGVGGLEHRKGWDTLLRALRFLPGHVHAAIAGAGPDDYALRGFAGGLGVDQRVHWLGFRQDVPRLLGAADVFVLPSRQEGMAVAMLEAMSAGVPVVATAGSGTEEALGARAGRPVAGWTVPVDEPAALAAAIGNALENSTDRTVEARWRADHWFGIDRMAAEYERVLFGS